MRHADICPLRYDCRLIQGIVIATHLGWMAFGAVSVLLPASPASSAVAFPVHVTATAVLLAFWAAFATQRSPWSYYLYVTFPCYFWDQALSRATGLPLLRLARRGLSSSHIAGHALRGGVVFVALHSIVVRSRTCRCIFAELTTVQAGYTHRFIWSAWLVVVGMLWPLFSWPREMLTAHWRLSLAWAGACLGTAIFPLLDVYREQNLIAM